MSEKFGGNVIEEREITISGINGQEKRFYISKVPATIGREILAKYPISAMPKLGEYQVNEDIMLKMINYTWVIIDENKLIRLSNKALIDNHCTDWEMLAKLEMAMLEYNTSFFANGKISKVLNNYVEKIPELVTKILMDFSQQLQNQGKQPSKN